MMVLTQNSRKPGGIARIASVFARAEGTAAIEFALVAPVMLLLIFGIIEFSLIMIVSSVLEGAVLMAAREGSTGYVPQGQTQDAYIAGLVDTRVGKFLDPKKLVISIPTASNNPGQIVQYTISYPWPVATQFLQRAIAPIAGTYMVTATGIVQNEFFQ